MRTSLNKVKLIDDHLFDTGTTEDALLFKAMLIIDLALKGEIISQQHTHDLVTRYSRGQLKKEIAAVHHRLFNNGRHKQFKQKVLNLFK